MSVEYRTRAADRAAAAVAAAVFAGREHVDEQSPMTAGDEERIQLLTCIDQLQHNIKSLEAANQAHVREDGRSMPGGGVSTAPQPQTFVAAATATEVTPEQAPTTFTPDSELIHASTGRGHGGYCGRLLMEREWSYR